MRVGTRPQDGPDHHHDLVRDVEEGDVVVVPHHALPIGELK